MIDSPEHSDELFDADFFADYEQELAGLSVEQQAPAALAGVLTVNNEDGSARSFEQIKAESEAFFANPLIREATGVLDALAMQYMQFCQAHGEGGAAMNEGALGTVFERGLRAADHVHEHGPDDQHENKTHKKEKGKKKTSFYDILSKLGSVSISKPKQKRASKPAMAKKDFDLAA